MKGVVFLILKCRMHYYCIPMGSLDICAFEDVGVRIYLQIGRELKLAMRLSDHHACLMRIGLFMCARHRIIWFLLAFSCTSYLPVILINHDFLLSQRYHHQFIHQPSAG